MTASQMHWRGRAVMYRAFDDTGRLLYVGQTINLPARVGEHRSQTWWWKLLTSRLRVQVFPDAAAAKAAEKVAIQEERPVFNAMGYGDWRDKPYWSAADHDLYYQWYRDMIFRQEKPERAQWLLDAHFADRTNRHLWAVS